MIDAFDNILQIAVLLFCVLVSAVRAIRTQSKAWTLLAFFYGCHALGDLYMLLCVLFYDEWPEVSATSDLNWYAAFLLLYLLLRQVAPPTSAREKRPLPWLGFVFALLMAVFYFSCYVYWNTYSGFHFVLWEKALINLSYGMLMGLLMFSGIRRLMDRQQYPVQRSLCIVTLVYCLLEHALWTVSCFWSENALTNPYYWFDFMLTACMLLFLPATKKAVTE